VTGDLVRDHVDPALERIIRFAAGLELRDPVRWRLAEHRRRSMRRTLGQFVTRANDLGPQVAGRDPDAVAAFDRLISEALDCMREARCPERPLASRLDRALYKPGSELLDDPSFPMQARADALEKLHRLNEQLGSYDSFLGALMPLVEAAERAGRRPVRIHDLAAGHAGFALFLKQRLGARVELEASDIKPEYLEIGRRRARAAGVHVDLFVADALALDAVRERDVDVVTCTQSIHHFSPGMVSRMFGEAARAAKVGVCLIDGERSWLMFALIGVATALYGRSWVLFHDGLVSLRRMFYEEELALLAGLSPGIEGGRRIETGAMLPGHAFVRCATSRAAE
jgi:hypothetical protein